MRMVLEWQVISVKDYKQHGADLISLPRIVCKSIVRIPRQRFFVIGLFFLARRSERLS